MSEQRGKQNLLVIWIKCTIRDAMDATNGSILQFPFAMVPKEKCEIFVN